ncbi:TPA: helix-turn-helix transcriptional regulator [Legionella pneumophila]|nr:helix-turn-helix transcriptional regulator [Legionella pneumophila]HAT1883535.1 helix-turn-helix transcriptional regulator [Legionella pneumophila]HAT2114828.1 helix-turn-helix transcriptional regulator [Legionella pneumophila]HAT8721354.1 helix-turn-helix domain-containing protein [Legionella pneumophila]
MRDNLKLSQDKFNIFHEGRKRRVFVGELIYSREQDVYELIYDESYAYSDTAIPLGPELNLFQLHHRSEKGKLFKSLLDRIPSKENPAYKDYCASQGISPDEQNPIILLGSIGKRGPSSFIFEPIYYSTFTKEDIKKLRREIGLTQHDLAKVLDISIATLARIESGTSHDANTIKRIEIFFKFPEVALWQLKQTGGLLHSEVFTKLYNHFNDMKDKS